MKGLRLGDLGKLLFAVMLLVIILVAGTMGYHMISPETDLFTAFYMTVITITTVGFDEVEGIPSAARPLTLGLIFSGIGLISYVLYTVSQAVVEGEIKRAFGRHKLDKKISSLKNHIIVCGFGNIGAAIAHYLDNYQASFVIVEKNEEVATVLDEKKYLHVIGDATLDDVLQKAGIEKASHLLAATNSDSQNVFIILTARELNPKLIIHARGYADEAENRMLRAGADKVIFPDNIGGFRMAMGLMRPSFSTFLDVVSRSHEDENIAVDELHIGPRCSLIDHTIVDAQIRQNYNLIVLAIRNQEGSFFFNPGKDTIIHEGDTMIAIGLRKDLSLFAKHNKMQEK